MSLNFADIQNVLNRTLEEPLANMVNRANPVLQAMNKKAVASQEIYLKGILNSSHGAGPIEDGSDVTFDGTEKTTYVAPTLPWSTYIGKFSVPKRLIEATANQPEQMGSIFLTEIEEAAKDAADSCAADMFGGDTTNGLSGIQSIFDDGNTYAGVDRSLAANANFRAVVVDHVNAGGTAGQELSTNVLYQLDEEVFANAGYGFTERPDLYTGITDRGIMTKYKGLMETIDLSSLATAHFVNQANATGQLGLGRVGWQGIPIIRDRHVVPGATDQADTGRLYFIDMSKVFMCVLSNDSAAANIHQARGFMSAPDVDGIRASIEILGNSGENVKGYVKFYTQLACANPRKAGGMIKNVLNT